MTTRVLSLFLLLLSTSLFGQVRPPLEDWVDPITEEEHVLDEEKPTCNSGFLTQMNFYTDNNPEQSSWTITNNSTGEVVYDQNPYEVDQFYRPGFPYEHNICLTEGCYTLSVFDSGENGVDCVGSGWRRHCGYEFSYAQNGDVLTITGADFGAQHITEFCVGDSVIIEDPCDPDALIVIDELTNDFEDQDDLSGWGCRSGDNTTCQYQYTDDPLLTSLGAFRLTGKSWRSAIQSDEYDFSDFQNIKITIWGSNNNTVQFTNDFVRVEMICNGVVHLIDEALLGAFEISNVPFTYELSAAEYDFGNCRFRITAHTTWGNEVLIEEVEVWAGLGCGGEGETIARDNSISGTGKNGLVESTRRSIKGLTLYPNPATEFLALTSNEALKAASITTATGQLVRTLNLNSSQEHIELHDLTAGIYFLTVTSETGTETCRFVKR